jgi:hypothetical protein
VAYNYDVFLSYRHAGVVHEWVHEHFYPRLSEWLSGAATRDVAVFIDSSIEAGQVWPIALRNALCGSRVMVAVYSPQYFHSAWCQAEFRTILAREAACGLAVGGDARSLIFPVKFNDGEHFPEEATNITFRDLSGWNSPHAVFAETPAYVEFSKAVSELAEEIVRRLDDVPVWDKDWPIVEPGASLPTLEFPRL